MGDGLLESRVLPPLLQVVPGRRRWGQKAVGLKACRR
jgi:hypothetical protein